MNALLTLAVAIGLTHAQQQPSQGNNIVASHGTGDTITHASLGSTAVKEVSKTTTGSSSSTGESLRENKSEARASRSESKEAKKSESAKATRNGTTNSTESSKPTSSKHTKHQKNSAAVIEISSGVIIAALGAFL